MNIGGGETPSMGPPRRPGGGGALGFVKGIYNDEFKWSLVKSVGLFGIGVWIARECVGVDFMASAQAPYA